MYVVPDGFVIQLILFHIRQSLFEAGLTGSSEVLERTGVLLEMVINAISLVELVQCTKFSQEWYVFSRILDFCLSSYCRCIVDLDLPSDYPEQWPEQARSRTFPVLHRKAGLHRLGR